MASHAKRSATKSTAHSFKIGVGIGCLMVSSFLLYRLFHDPIRHEIAYTIRTIKSSPSSLTPPNTDFALTIDKIGASSAIIQDVDSLDSRLYQLALTRGVAHAKGTKLPGSGGNIFLFAHSSADLLTAARYNSVFYLMHHLVPGDPIKIWYKGREYNYAVSEKKVVSAKDTKYLNDQTSEEQLTLMTCWPPGTSLKRLIVIAKPL